MGYVHWIVRQLGFTFLLFSVLNSSTLKSSMTQLRHWQVVWTLSNIFILQPPKKFLVGYNYVQVVGFPVAFEVIEIRKRGCWFVSSKIWAILKRQCIQHAQRLFCKVLKHHTIVCIMSSTFPTFLVHHFVMSLRQHTIICDCCWLWFQI